MLRFLVLFFIPLAVCAVTTPASATPSQDPDTLSVPNESVYQLDTEWTTQDNDNIQLASFRGQPQLMALIYTHCGTVCPRMVGNMKQILSDLPEEMRGRVGRILVTIDPERDTPAQLRSYAEAHGLDLNQWTLLHGNEPQVRELAAVLGVRFKQEGNGMFSHSSQITVLDGQGVMQHQQQRLGDGTEVTVAAVENLLSPTAE